ARTAGASDAMILEVISLARAGETRWAAEPPAFDVHGPGLVAAAGPPALTGPAGRALALASWETSAVTVAFGADDAVRLAAAPPLRTMVSALAFGLGDDFDAPAFDAVVRL